MSTGKEHPGPRKTYKVGSFGAARAIAGVTLTGIKKMIHKSTPIRRKYQTQGLLG